MKTKCNLCIMCFLLSGLFLQRASAQANTELSNLVSPTKVNQSLLPITHNTKSLGSISTSWGNIFFGGSIYLDGKRFLANGNDTSNVFVGTNAGNKFRTSTGGYNTATGQYALYSYTSGRENTANGAAALYSNTTGSFNTATGYGALFSNTIGFGNTANADWALYSNTSGDFNTAIGEDALYSNTNGGHNTATGVNALYDNITGVGNTANGIDAGSSGANNTYCTFVGYWADKNGLNDFTNSTALGYLSRITASNQVRIGNSIVSSIGGYAPWTNLSDARFKKNVKENVPGLAFINQLHAVTYTMDVTKLRNFLGEDMENETTTAHGKMIREKNPAAEALIQRSIDEKEKMIRTGFVAQEVEAAAKKIGYDFSGVDKPANEHTPYGLRYSEFVVPLVRAVQELSKQNEDLQKQIDELRELVLKGNQQSSLNSSSTVLRQNVPNPFSNTTIIHYTLPQIFSLAKIIITDKNGKAVKEIDIQGTGKGTLNVNAANLSPGTYQYSLIIDGKLMNTRQMIRVK